jgi:hypothetical protein
VTGCTSTRTRASRGSFSRALAVLACAATVPALALAPSAVGDIANSSTGATQVTGGTVTSGQALQPGALSKAIASATLEQCATAAAPQTERSATFTGEMTATADTARMELRIDVEELAAGQTRYRTVSAPGLGVWQRSNPGVKDYTHIQQVTNLSAPAVYRGAIRFHWLNAKGRVIKGEELHTASCEQPATPSTSTTGEEPTSSSSGQ